MDGKIKKCCPSCSQFYQLKSLTVQNHGNIPLFLSCGHSMCENCVRDIIKFAEPIECKICHKDMEISTAEITSLIQSKMSLYQIFPVNFYLLGELTMQKIQAQEEKEKQDANFYIDIKAIMESNSKAEGMCMECHSPTSKMCQQCGIIVCNTCFNKSHKNFIIFKNHVLQDIEAIQDQITCPTHIGKPLDYYCKTCEKGSCMDCLMVGGEKSCKNHNVVSSQDVNEELLSEITKLAPEVDEKLKRFTKTATDIGNIMNNLANDPNTILQKLSNEVEQHFSSLLAFIQKQKEDIANKLVTLKEAKQNSLLKSKNQIMENIKGAKKIIDAIQSLQEKKLGQVNLSAILDDVKLIINEAWYLTCNNSDDALQIKVKTDALTDLQNFITLEKNGSMLYELLSTDELTAREIDIPPAPQSIVYPPELPKDVRQLNKKVEKEKKKEKEEKKPPLIRSVPQYRSKSGSCSSLNSITSDSSYNSCSRNMMHKSGNNYVNTNQPPSFSHSYQMKPLLPGDQDIVYISHIVDPHNFFVQRACHQSLVEELMREFRNASSMPKPSLNHITEGRIYLVFIKVDNFWQRCRVLSIDHKDSNKPMFKVFCFDFGSLELVSIDRLRLVPSFRLQNPPPLAIHCSLDSAQPISGSWTSDDALLIQNIIDKSVFPPSSSVQNTQNSKQAVLSVTAVSSGQLGARVSCELATFEHGVSVAHALAFHGRARLAPNTQYPKLLGIKEKPKIFSSNNDFQPHAKEEVFITHVVSPDKFYVRKRHLQSVYEKMCNDLNRENNLNDSAGTIYLPEKNMVCAVKTERTWERARVLELPGRARVHVHLLDSGDEVLVHWNKLRRLHDKFCTLRALATECHLAGVTPLNQKWSPGSVNLLSGFESRSLLAHVEAERGRGSVGVTLYDETDPDDVVCVNKLMIQRKYAVSFGVFMFEKDTEMEDLVITNKPLQETEPVVKPKKTIQILKRDTPVKEVQKEKDLEAKDKGPYRIEVKVLNYQSPSLLYVALLYQQKMFTELFENIQKYYTKKQTQARNNWKVGDRCCTVCIQSQTWRRAAILEINNDNAKVFYSDFAIVETVPIANLRDSPPEFLKCGDAAIVCHLSGVIPAVGEEWPSLTKEYLKELLEAYPRIFITKNGVFKDKSIPVELWVYHTIQGGALEPNVSEWRCLNKKIIEQGLGIPDKTQGVIGCETSQSTKEETEISFLNLTGSIEDWLQIEPMPLKPLKVESDAESNSRSSTPSEVDTEKPNTQDSNTVFISDWLPPEPLPNKEFIGVPTYVDNDGMIYLHDVTQQETLNLIRKALDVRFKNPDPKAKFVKWNVGEPCVALYYLDNKFYRGRVMEVNVETSSCIIHYIDYGNEEICPFVNLRKSIALYQIPTQAHKCILGRIRPIDKNWDRQTLDYIHKSIVEKECHIKVLSEPIGDLNPIEIRYDKLCINEHLVDFEMAEFTDGSKVKVQKYKPKTNNNKILNESFDRLTVDSGPDYIIEQEDSTSLESPVSFEMEKYKNKDWNEIVDEENKFLDGRFVSYSNFSSTEFFCNINFLNEVNTLELSVVHDDDTKAQYEIMLEELQEIGFNSPPIDGVFENKACIALFSEDQQWYRAVILQYSEAKAQVKVKYIDYGNTGVVSLSDVREIDIEYTKLPPIIVTAALYGVDINPNVSKETIFDRYSKTFLDQGPFQAKVVDSKNSIPLVTLHDENGKLIYEDFFEDIFIKRE